MTSSADNMGFIGRQNQLQKLESLYSKKKSQIGIVFGRRRVGKSELIKQFAKNKKHLFFEGLEDEESLAQITHFKNQMAYQLTSSILKTAKPKTWPEVFDILTEILKSASKDSPYVLFFDELPWMSCLKTSLVSLIKYYWDNHWKSCPVFLILCGSTSSFMISHVLRSKALYGRISWSIDLKKLQADEAKLFFKNKRSRQEILKYLMLFGGVPKYLEEIPLNRSFLQNINEMCFKKEALFAQEFDRIFFSHFGDHNSYKRICEFLSTGPKDLNEISLKLKIPSGGGLKNYLDNLFDSGIFSIENE
ncbi:MAG: AAA family ATPase, partial [Pseudobdellovibrionaceae bacterium]